MNTDKNQQSKLVYEQLIELICYSIVSARNLLQEPKIYGPLRMVEVANKLIEILSPEDLKRSYLSALRERIEAVKESVVEGEDSFASNLDSLVSDVLSILTNNHKEGAE